MTHYFGIKILFFIITFGAPSVQAKEVCGEVRQFPLREVAEYSVLSQNGCEGLKKIWDNRAKHLNQSSEKIRKEFTKFSNEFVRCNESLYNACYKNTKPIEEATLNQMFQEWKKDPLLNMPEPAGQCTQRSIVLSEKLASQGYDVEIAHFEAPTIVGIYKNDRLKFEQYAPAIREDLGFHYATSVLVQLPNGKVEKRILDPQFANRPMALDEYSELITGAKCSEKRERKTGCQVRFKKPVAHNYMEYDDYVLFLQGTLKVTDFCGWTLLKPSIKSIEEFNNEIKERRKSSELENVEGESFIEISKRLNISNLRNRIQFQEGKIETLLQNLPSIKDNSTKIRVEAELKRSRQLIQDLNEEIKIRNY